MKKVIGTLAFFSILVWVCTLVWKVPQVKGTRTNKEPSQKKENSLKESKAISDSKMVSPVVPSITQEKHPRSHELSDWVSFEVVHGLAIAQGDILLGNPENPTIHSGNFKMAPPQYWDKPEIPYVIDGTLSDPNRVESALRHIEEKTGLRFISWDNQPDAILFKTGEQYCLSPLGRQGGLQPILLDGNCTWQEVTHEVLHALGFIHEHSRSDRDQFIQVLWDNVDKKYTFQFEMLPASFLGPASDTGFDYQSIMLYESRSFASHTGLETLKSKSTTPISPSRQGLSHEDIRRIRKLFKLN